MELVVLALEPIESFATRSGTRLANRRREGEQQRAIRRQAAGGEQIDLAHRFDAEAPARSLIGERGVHEPVEQDPTAAAEQRLERLLDELRACSGVQQRLGAGSDPQRRVLHKLAHTLRRAHAAGLPKQLHIGAAGPQGRQQLRRQRRLAGAVDPLDCDQASAGHGGLVPTLHGLASKHFARRA